jgi:hypothetical protein
METGVSQEEIDQGREELLKVETGEWTDEDYRANVMKKHNLHIVDLKSPITKKPSILKKAKGFDKEMSDIDKFFSKKQSKKITNQKERGI